MTTDPVPTGPQRDGDDRLPMRWALLLGAGTGVGVLTMTHPMIAGAVAAGGAAVAFLHKHMGR